MKINRWHIYNFLKGTTKMELDLEDVRNASPKEIKEGFIEYLIVKSKEKKLKK